MNLLLLDPEDLREGRACLRGRRAAHLRTVLRKGRGDAVRLGMVRGPRGVGRVVAMESGGRAAPVILEVTLDQPPSPRPLVDLLLAVPRPKVLRRVLRTLGSIGVGRLDLVNTWRVEKSYFQSPALAPEALAQELRLGAEQGATTWLPDVGVHPLLMPYLDEAWPIPAPAASPLGASPPAASPPGASPPGASPPSGPDEAPPLRLIAHPRAPLPLAQAVRAAGAGSAPRASRPGGAQDVPRSGRPGGAQDVPGAGRPGGAQDVPRSGRQADGERASPPHAVVALGPEGGFIEAEVETFAARGFLAVSLGAPVLAVESVIPWLLGQLDLLLDAPSACSE